MRLVVTARAIA